MIDKFMISIKGLLTQWDIKILSEETYEEEGFQLKGCSGYYNVNVIVSKKVK